jgi:4-nitrophenyl phosphatase
MTAVLMDVSAYKAILADMDGTMNRGSTLLPGAASTHEKLSVQGVRWLFISNNATVQAVDLAHKLRKMGLPATDDQVINSVTALVDHLANESTVRNVYVVGQERLIDAIRSIGIHVTDVPDSVDVVVTAMDRGFTYEKLEKAVTAIHNGAMFWATNMDASLPVEDGVKPGAGSIVAAVATAAGRQPDRVFGKPEPDMARIALSRLGLSARECLVIGDRMETDIRFAVNAGMDSALVLTGATSREDLSRHPFSPVHILDSVADLKGIV